MKKQCLWLLILLIVGSACQQLPATPRQTSALSPPATGAPALPTATPTPTLTAVPPTPTPTPIPPTPHPPTPSATHTPSPTDTPIPPTATPTPSIEGQLSAIESYLEELAAAGGFSGSVLIAHQGVPVLTAAYGEADRSLGIPNQIDTKFNLGSMDKMFTAVAIMQLAEAGKLDLHQTVGTVLPDYPNPDVAGAVTIHQLLIHTSGLGSYFDSPLYPESYNQIRSLQDYLVLFADDPPLFPPGSQFAYSNSGYIVLGLVIEAASEQSYYDHVREYILEPSGMDDTACYELDGDIPNLAIGYTTLDNDGNDTGQITDNSFALPLRGGSAGGGYSTAPDLLSFANALLTHQLLSPESTELMLEGKIEIADNVQYAYGFFDRVVRGYRMVGHGGGFPGICSLLATYPQLEYTVIVLSNSDGDCLGANEFITENLLP